MLEEFVGVAGLGRNVDSAVGEEAGETFTDDRRRRRRGSPARDRRRDACAVAGNAVDAQVPVDCLDAVTQPVQPGAVGIGTADPVVA